MAHFAFIWIDFFGILREPYSGLPLRPLDEPQVPTFLWDSRVLAVRDRKIEARTVYNGCPARFVGFPERCDNLNSSELMSFWPPAPLPAARFCFTFVCRRVSDAHDHLPDPRFAWRRRRSWRPGR